EVAGGTGRVVIGLQASGSRLQASGSRRQASEILSLSPTDSYFTLLSEARSPKPMLGLYIHIPFCAAICNYCNFNRGLFDGDLKTKYVAALIAEIEKAGGPGPAGRAGGPGGAGRAADTIYFGGGTPSLLSADEVAAIIRACRNVFDVAADYEITLEANPETVSTDGLRGFREAGV